MEEASETKALAFTTGDIMEKPGEKKQTNRRERRPWFPKRLMNMAQERCCDVRRARAHDVGSAEIPRV